MKSLFLLLAVLTATIPTHAQSTQGEGPRIYPSGTADPPACTTGQIFIRLDIPAIRGCTSTNTWTTLGSAGGGSGAGPSTYTVTFSGMGTSIVGGATQCIPISGTGTLQSVRIQACNGFDSNSQCSVGGSATVDIKTTTSATFASSGPAGASTIKSTGSLLTVSSAYAADGDLTNWTTTGFGGKTACVVMSSPTAVSVDVIMVVQ